MDRGRGPVLPWRHESNEVDQPHELNTPALTTGQAARHCHVSLPAIKRWIRQGRLRAFRTPGGHYRIAAAEFARFCRRHGLPPYGARGPGERRVLLADDNRAFLETLLAVLRDDRRLKLETATDGYETLVKVGAFRPHLLVLDALMPSWTGWRSVGASRAAAAPGP